MAALAEDFAHVFQAVCVGLDQIQSVRSAFLASQLDHEPPIKANLGQRMRQLLAIRFTITQSLSPNTLMRTSQFHDFKP